MPDVAEQEVWEGGGRRYTMEKVVGNGAFGVVWRAREDGASECVAIKKARQLRPNARCVWRPSSTPRATRARRIRQANRMPSQVVLDRRYHNRELEMMKGLEHECVIRLHHHFEKP